MPSLTDDMVHIEVTIRPPGDARNVRLMSASFAYDRDTLANLHIPPRPNPTDYMAIDFYTAAIRRRRSLVECIGGDIAHKIIEAITPKETTDEAAA